MYHNSHISNSSHYSSSLYYDNGSFYDIDEDDEVVVYSPDHSYSVDCTLSLGTPSTRATEFDASCNDQKKKKIKKKWSDKLGMSSMFSSSSSSSSATRNHRGSGSGGGGGGADPLTTRRCANCDTTSTPLWRNGPRGPKSLCNACGIRYKKEERRALAARETHHHQMMMMNNNSYHHHHYSSDNYGNNNINEYMINEDDHINHHPTDDSETGVQFVDYWRYNASDRSSFVRDF